jgi:hypothetical protein
MVVFNQLERWIWAGEPIVRTSTFSFRAALISVYHLSAVSLAFAFPIPRFPDDQITRSQRFLRASVVKISSNRPDLQPSACTLSRLPLPYPYVHPT